MSEAASWAADSNDRSDGNSRDLDECLDLMIDCRVRAHGHLADYMDDD